MMRLVMGSVWPASACLASSLAFLPSAALAQAPEAPPCPAIVREALGSFPISSSVSVPPGSRVVFVSGTVPAVVDENAAQGSAARYGDTETQTRSVLGRIKGALEKQGMGLGDVVMARVFLVAPEGKARMDFAGMMKAWTEFFGTEAQPNKPARSAMQVAGLVDPGWLVEIEATAAQPPATTAPASTAGGAQ